MKRKCLVAAILIGLVSVLCSAGFAGKDGKHHKGRGVIKAVVKAIFPSAAFKKAESEEVSIKVIEVDLMQDGKECSVNVTEDGTVLSTEVEVGQKGLPAAVAKALKKAAGKSKITKVEKEEIRAVVKVVELEKPVIVYEAEFVKDGKVYEAEIASCGKILSVELDDDDEEDGDRKGHKKHGKDNDDDDSEEVSIKDVPEKVRATINKIAKGGEIEEIEREKEDGKVVYEVEIEYGEKEVEFKIAPNGKILSKKVEDEDGDDDDK